MALTSSSTGTKIPSKIILDSADLVKQLRKDVKELFEAGMTETEIMDTVIDSMRYTASTPLELPISCEVVVTDELGPLRTLTADEAGNELYEKNPVAEKNSDGLYRFGMAIHQLMCDMEAYINGMLVYEFSSFVGSDIVLGLIGTEQTADHPNLIMQPNGTYRLQPYGRTKQYSLPWSRFTTTPPSK